MFSKDRIQYGAGRLLLAGLIATTAFAADAPAPATQQSRVVRPASRRHGREQDEGTRRQDVQLCRHERRRQDHPSRVSRRRAAAGPQGGPGGDAPGMHGQHGPAMGMEGPGIGGHGSSRPGPDGGITPQEREAFEADLYKALDTDHNGQLSQAEFAKAWETVHTMMKKQVFANSTRRTAC